ncbi:MAG: AAA family ATPase [Dehalococcoidales bacterium]|nr:MAG: AAA family ATPase [Dehalococcoidales bacterium]
MAKPPKTLTAFGKDLVALLEQAGKLSIREYADQANVNYKYVNQLRTVSTRQPGKLYPNLLKPFVQLKVIDLADSHQLSLRHRNKPLSIVECQELFPDIPEQKLAESIRQVLESKDRHDTIIRTVVPPRITYSPIYRRVFVGRKIELGQLRSAFDSAVSGQGSLVMVVGEPGIGKTVLCEQLVAYVSSLGGKSLVGHCYSERSLSRPYLAFIEVLRSHVQARGVSQLRKELGSGAANLCRIVPEITEKLKVRPRPKRDPEEERYRLMEAVTHFLGNIAAVQPLLVVLEDLHNADKDTLEMLTHVSRSLASTRLLIVGTYRDVEVDRSHPLSETLAELRRLPVFERVPLKGLDADVVKRMLSAITGKEMSVSLAEAIHKQTEGNPLFVQEVIRDLVEEGLISPQGDIGQPSKDISIEMRIPDSLKDVIGRRLSRLSEPCNNVLATASVIGRDFRLEVLQRVSGMTDEELFKALEEALKAAVIIEEKTGALATVDYSFAHAFFRQTLYEEIIVPRRIRLHRQIAQALDEVYVGHPEEYAAELAEHLSYSSDPVDLARAIRYGEIAAQQAIDIYAYWEAIRLLEQALKVQKTIAPDDKAKRCDLLLALGDARDYAGEYRHVLDEEAPQALLLAEAVGDHQRAVRVGRLAMTSLTHYGAGPAAQTPEGIRWTDIVDRYAAPGTIERVWADIYLAARKTGARELADGLRLYHRCSEIALELGDTDAYLASAGAYVWACPPFPEYIEEARRLADQITQLWDQSGRGHYAAFAKYYLSSFFLGLGERTHAEDLMRELAELSKRTGTQYTRLTSLVGEACFHTMDGRFEDALETVQSIFRTGEEMNARPRANEVANFSNLMLRIYLGEIVQPITGVYRFYRVVGRAHAGDHARALTMLDSLVEEYAALPERVKDYFPIMMLYLETALVTKHLPATETFYAFLCDTPFKTTGFMFPTCVARHLGAAAASLGRPEEARKHYQEAIKVCTDIRFRPELALTSLQLAELLLEHYPDEKKDALEHLEFAINEFREMKMQPSLERALRRKEILGA